MPTPRTRLAPSPTGALHLGNVRTFLVNWALARQQGWEIVLRVEDLDGPRHKAGAAEAMVDTLAWLGLNWDEGPYYQREDLTAYREATARLAELRHVYPCRCTRKEIQAASLSAPHGDQHELCYPGTCRPDANATIDVGLLGAEGVAWRVQVPSGQTSFVDEFAGPQEYDVAQTVGDFLVGTKLGLPSYQLAVVVDDARQGISEIVRGDDLLSSTPRQMLLYDLLCLGPPPTYTHLPLVLGEDGRRLAKRHGDTRVSYYREQGVSAERILGLLAEWCGLAPRRQLTAGEFLRAFSLERLPRQPAVFTKADDAWLLQ
ncbi:MAG: tRNA glutamyl-Q(34) synthetase GluQRS [Planctomycetes bacterium]|nr:tRNA glutamyl-Q(34) synthetase GluQRS [Planctomycetota bacterium]